MKLFHVSGKDAMALTQALILQLHPTDYGRLTEAAGQTGQNIDDLIRLAIHREVSAILANSSAMPPARPETTNAARSPVNPDRQRCALTDQARSPTLRQPAALSRVAA